MMTKDEAAWRTRADAEIANGHNTGIATLCNECLGVIHRTGRGKWRTRAWVPRYCECGTTIPMAEDYAAHGFSLEEIGKGYLPVGRIPD